MSADDREEGIAERKNPGGVAAACLYAAATERSCPLTQQVAAQPT